METVEVPIGECLCPKTPHPDGDVVWMAATADLAMCLAAQSALTQSSGYVGDASAEVYSVYVRRGVTRWNVQDDKGKVIPITPDSILDRLTWRNGGKVVALKGIDLYHSEIFDPLPLPRQASQPPTPSNGSTSRSPSSGHKRPTSSKPSSPSTPAAIQ